jgi:hypothetical protein
MLNKIFWTLICIEGAVILPMLIYVLMYDEPKGSDHSLALFFVLFPTLALAAVALAYAYTKRPAVHTALIVVPLLFTIPGITAIYNRVRLVHDELRDCLRRRTV